MSPWRGTIAGDEIYRRATISSFGSLEKAKQAMAKEARDHERFVLQEQARWRVWRETEVLPPGKSRVKPPACPCHPFVMPDGFRWTGY